MSPQESTGDFATHVRNSTYDIGITLRDIAVRVELELKGIGVDIEHLRDNVRNVDATLEDFEAYIKVAKLLVIFLDMIVISLMTACVLSWMGEQYFIPICIRKTLLIPLFITFLILFLILSTSVMVGAMVGADFCSKPDEFSKALIIEYQGQLSPLVFGLMMHYIMGCLPGTLPPKLEFLSSAVTSIGGSIHSLATNETGLAELCEVQVGSAKLLPLLERTDTTVHGIYDVLIRLRQILECQNYNPIYTTLVYDALCSGGAAGLSWVFFTSFSMAVFSMSMVTLRVAIHRN